MVYLLVSSWQTSAEICATLSFVFFIVNSSKGPDWKCLSQNELVDPGYDHKIEAWLAKVRRVTFLPRCAVSLFRAWGNCFKAGCSWRLFSFAWLRSSGFFCWDGSSIFGPFSTLRSSSLPHRRTERPNKSSSEIRDARSQAQRACPRLLERGRRSSIAICTVTRVNSSFPA